MVYSWPMITDMAPKVDVSIAIVSRVFNGTAPVESALVERVRMVMADSLCASRSTKLAIRQSAN
jgi:hypothetical protein